MSMCFEVIGAQIFKKGKRKRKKKKKIYFGENDCYTGSGSGTGGVVLELGVYVAVRRQ